MSTDLSMIWLPKLSRVAEESFGLAKTMMEMCKVILLPKVTVLSVL